MKREEFDHVVRAASAIVDDEIVVIGSQAIHGEIEAPPDALIVSREVALYRKSAPERAVEIDGAIGDGSLFDTAATATTPTASGRRRPRRPWDGKNDSCGRRCPREVPNKEQLPGA
jgi:hypothetical protein